MTDLETDRAFEELLEFLKLERGFDFTGYKRSTLHRRTRKRMDEVGAESYVGYRGFLEANPQEFTHLFNTILINVTGFFRDAEAWDVLLEELRPRVLERKRAGEPIRVWSAGCASGQETYTLVIMLAEALGLDRFREQVKVYATDLDDDALAQARLGSYTAKNLEGMPEELRDRYFELSAGRYVFRADLRRYVIFGRHDLVKDAPMSHLDLLVCRNVLMYFNAEIQSRIMNRFHFALDDSGLLFLGKAEMMRSHGNLFTPVNLRARIFSRVPRVNLRDRLLAISRPADLHSGTRMEQQLRVRTAALEADPVARLVVSAGGTVLFANAAARALFNMTHAEVGRPLQDLTVSYRPLELRSRIDRVIAERQAVLAENVEYPAPSGEFRRFDVHFQPLVDGDGLLGVSVAFVDASPYYQLFNELQEANQELETAFEELQSTNEELETTNEELQSTIEELETTNEELQSTNEELETMNEELQSTNEELETINDELHRRTGELNDANAYITSILTSLRVAVVVLDSGLDIRIWNRKAEDLWGLRSDEVEGTAFQNLDIGLPVERLKPAIRACTEGRSEYEELVLDAVNRRGRSIRCRVACTPFLGPDRDVRGAVVLMEEWQDGTEPA